MERIDKLIVLDACVNGDITKLRQLLDQAYSGFNTFFSICKERLNPKDAEDYIFYGHDDKTARFGVVQKNTLDDVAHIIEDTSIPKDIEITQADGVIMVNIHIS